MYNHNHRMLIALFFWPVTLIIGSVILSFIIDLILHSLAGLFKAAPLDGTIFQYFQYIPLTVFTVGIVKGLYQGYLFWSWQNGDQDCCFNCGGMTKYIPDGRYGPYVKCLKCRTNRSTRQ